MFEELDPVKVKKGGSGSIKLVRRSLDEPGKEIDSNEAAITRQDLHIVGEGFEDGEVVLNFDETDGRTMNTRISAQAVEGKFDALMPVFGWTGDWRVTAYQPNWEAGSGRVLKMVDQITLTITA